MGYLVRQDERTIVVRQQQPDGRSRETTFAKGDLDELIITVSPERLAKLDPSQPRLYREYAEELAEKQRDPEARDTAIRLYAIVAVHGEAKLRHGALLGLVEMARSADEERLFRAAAYLHDPEHDGQVLADATPSTGLRRGTGPASPALLSVFRLARQGKGAAAKAILDRPEVRAEAGQIAALIRLDELQAACSANSLSPRQLQQLLKAELALEDEPSAAERSSSQNATWSQVKLAAGFAPLPLVRLERLTEYDPAECLFRSGKWVKP